MTTQINIRLDDQTVAGLDRIAEQEGRTRAEVVRDAVNRRLHAAAGERVANAYRRAYSEHPETPEELRRAEAAASRLTEDESWEPWW